MSDPTPAPTDDGLLAQAKAHLCTARPKDAELVAALAAALRAERERADRLRARLDDVEVKLMGIRDDLVPYTFDKPGYDLTIDNAHDVIAALLVEGDTDG